jgi:hypothetical protein
MSHTQLTHKRKGVSWLQHVRHWLAHPTSEVLPPIFGDAAPPDLKVFEAKIEEARHQVHEVPGPPSDHGRWNKPIGRH